jgi:hypothetical protein
MYDKNLWEENQRKKRDRLIDAGKKGAVRVDPDQDKELSEEELDKTIEKWYKDTSI